RAANRAVRVLSKLELAELHSQRIEEQQSGHETISAAEDQLDCFHGLNGADDARKNAQHAAFRAGWDEAGRRRFGIEAAVARAVGHAEHGNLAFEPENRAVHVGLAEQNAGVIDEITRGEIVGAVDDDVKVLEKFKRVGAGQLRSEGLDLNVGIEIRKAGARGFALGLADIAGAESDLSLEIGKIHDVEIDEPQFSHAGSSKIKAERRAEAAGANEQHF